MRAASFVDQYHREGWTTEKVVGPMFYGGTDGPLVMATVLKKFGKDDIVVLTLRDGIDIGVVGRTTMKI